MFRVVGEPLDMRQALEAVRGPGRGAVATFAGTVRDHHLGRRVVRLEYHAYAAMAEQVMMEIGESLSRQYGEVRVAMLHRVGVLTIGEISVIVAVAAPHRREALAACAQGIDRLKAEAPIWKKEFYTDGSAWIEEPSGRGPAAHEPVPPLLPEKSG
jgi:molybdopterin synthase catalytic subunit